MPITQYSVLKGTPTAGKTITGNGTHYAVTLTAPGGPFTVAINIESVDGSEVLYLIDSAFIPPAPAPLAALAAGIHTLPSQSGGLALDYVRSTVNGAPMVTLSQLALLPERLPETEHHHPRHNRAAAALSDAVITLIQQAIAAKATMYAFGSAFADNGVTDGIHDIHMNQGNTLNNHSTDNGIWQDGAVFLHFPSAGTSPASWSAIFIAFQTQSWTTDASGNPT